MRANVPIGGFFKLFEFRGGISKYHHDELEADGAIGSSFFTQRRGDARRRRAERARRLGRHERRPVSRPGRTHLAATRNICPTAANRQLGLFTLQIAGHAARCASKAGAGSSSPSSHADARSRKSPANGGAVGDHADRTQLHAGLRFARRQLRVRPGLARRACRCRTASARPRSTNYSPTARTAAASSSWSAIPTWARRRAMRSSSACTTRPARSTSRAASITAASPTSFIQAPTGDDPRTACRSMSIARARRILRFRAGARRQVRQGARHRLGRRAGRRRGARDDQGTSARRRRSRRSGCWAR